MTILEEIIAGATDDAVSTSNLLRKALVVAHNLDALNLADWARSELNGYEDIGSLPTYRANIDTPVRGFWGGYFQATATQPVSPSGVPDDAVKTLFTVHFLQSVAELEQLSRLDEDPGVAWDPQHVGIYNKWITEGKVPHLENFALISAQRIVTRAHIAGLLNAIRNRALEFALGLQKANPQAGSQGGPTVEEPPIQAAVYSVTNYIFGKPNNVAVGDRVRQKSEVVANDVDSLVAAARRLGLGGDALVELRKAADAPDTERRSRLGAVVEKVRDGALAVGGVVAANIAADALQDLINRFLGS